MIEDAFSPQHIAALRDEIDALEAELNPAGQEQAVLHERAAAAREFCGCEVFQRIVHDILNVPDVRLFHDQAVYKKPCPGRTFPFHQVLRGMLFTGVPSS